MRRFEVRSAGGSDGGSFFFLSPTSSPLQYVPGGGVCVWDPRFWKIAAVRGCDSYNYRRRFDGLTSATAMVLWVQPIGGCWRASPGEKAVWLPLCPACWVVFLVNRGVAGSTSFVHVRSRRRIMSSLQQSWSRAGADDCTEIWAVAGKGASKRRQSGHQDALKGDGWGG
jgi:hypothetical protein